MHVHVHVAMKDSRNPLEWSLLIINFFTLDYGSHTGLVTLHANNNFITYAGIPTSPTNLRSVIIHHDYFSTVLFTWDAPNDNSRVDYYQYTYQVENGTDSFAYNTSNSTATLSEIFYNQNTTFSVFSLNCISDSAPLSQTIYIGRRSNIFIIIVMVTMHVLDHWQPE